jgi:hypothetical protein
MMLQNAKCGKIILKKRGGLCRLFNWKNSLKIKILFDFLTEEINTKYFKAENISFGTKKTTTDIPSWITKQQDEIFHSVYHTNKYDYSLYLLKKFFTSSKYSDKIYDAENIEIISIYHKPQDESEVIVIIKLFDDNSKILFVYDSIEFTESEIGVIINRIFQNYQNT